jgi:hypothetical protein
MKITYQPTGINNFHNSSAINLIISGEKTDGHSGLVYRISRNQAQKISNHFCGVTDCRCPHGAAQQLNEDGTEYGIRVGYCE